MKIYSLFFLFLITVLSASGNTVTDEEPIMSGQSSATSGACSFFINVNGESTPHITGGIQCEQDAQYTFTFGFDGDGSYEVVVGDKVLTNNNGPSLRSFTVDLKAGYTSCSVSVYGGGSFAYGRLTITHINGNTSYPDTGGYIDLVAVDY